MVERLGRRLTGSVLLWDILLTLVALYSTSFLRAQLAYGNDLTREQTQVPLLVYGIIVCVWSVIFLVVRPQRAVFTSTLTEAIGKLLAAVALAVLTFAGVLYLSLRDMSRLQFLYFATIDLVLLLALHLGVRLVIRTHQPHSHRPRTLIVGAATQADQFVREFARRPWVGLQIIGCTTDQPNIQSSVPILGTIDQTTQIVQQHHVQEIIFVGGQQEQIARISLQLVQQPVMLHMVPSMLDLAFVRTSVESVGGVPLISLRESAISEPQRFFKRLFDVAGSVTLLLLLSPIMLFIACLIKLESSGPVFFLQERIGEHGRRFRMIKFRSMYQDAEQRWQDVAQRDEQGRLQHKREDDPRVTRVGQKLRRTSVDELPQLLNVLRGEMSLVGPRPEMPYIALHEYEPWQWQRFRVLPGMTGWWQVNGRGEKLMHMHTEEDLYYIQNYSFWLDVKILCMTISAVFRRQGAF